MSGVEELGPAPGWITPPGAVEVLVVASSLPDRAGDWIGTYVQRATTVPTVWISLGEDADRVAVVREPARYPLPGGWPALVDAVRYLKDLRPAWVVSWQRSHLDPRQLLEARPDLLALLCGRGEREEQQAIWSCGDLAGAAAQHDLAVPPATLAVAGGDRDRAVAIARHLEAYVRPERLVPLPRRDPLIGNNGCFREREGEKPLSIDEVVRAIREP